MEHWGDYVNALKLLDRNIVKPNDEVGFVTFIHVISDTIEEMLFADSVPTGFAKPKTVELTVSGPSGKSMLTVPYSKLVAGVRVAGRAHTGDVYRVSYRLRTPSEQKLVRPDDLFRRAVEVAAVPVPTIVVKKPNGAVKKMGYPNVQVQQLWFDKLDASEIDDFARRFHGCQRWEEQK